MNKYALIVFSWGFIYVGFVCFVPSMAKCFLFWKMLRKLLLNVIDVYFCVYRVRLMVVYTLYFCPIHQMY